jgi:hypothetical protein
VSLLCTSLGPAGVFEWLRVEPAYGEVLIAQKVKQRLHLREGPQLQFRRLEPSGKHMHRQFNIQQVYVVPTLCVYAFCVDLRTHSDYFPIQH